MGVIESLLRKFSKDYYYLLRSRDNYKKLYENECVNNSRYKYNYERVLRILERLHARDDGGDATFLERRQVCFMHIGKTAGTSLQNALFAAYQGFEIYHDSLLEFDRVSAAELKCFDVVIGHFMYQHVKKLRNNRFLITFLRNPVERVLSNYYFLRERSGISVYSRDAVLAAKEMSLKEFLLCSDPGVRMITESFQTKAMAADIRIEKTSVNSDLSSIAEAHLEEFDFVGIVEYYNKSVEVLSEMLSRKLNVLNENARSSGKLELVSSEVIEIIRSLNQDDINLYENAKDKFVRQYMSYS